MIFVNDAEARSLMGGDLTWRRRQLCWELSWVHCHLSLTFN